LTSLSAYSLIVLAAGAGKRYGGVKGLIDAGGEPLISMTLASFADYGGSEAVVVVSDENAPAFAAALPEFATAIDRRGLVDAFGLKLRVVLTPNPELGPFASLQTALALLEVSADGAFVLPVDVPIPRRPVWRALTSALTDEIEAAVPTFAGRGGHPVLLGRAILSRLMSLDPMAPQSRLDWLLADLGSRVARLPVDSDDILVNLNNHLAIAAWQAARGT